MMAGVCVLDSRSVYRCDMSNSNRTPERAAAFCAALAESCNVGKACAAIGMGRRTAYDWREGDETFAAMWDQAMRAGVTALEDEAHRRAFGGSDKPLTHQGQFTYLRDFAAIDGETGETVQPHLAPLLKDARGNPLVATVKEYSDTLAIFLLKAHNPDKYRENSKVELTGSLDLRKLSDEELDQELAELAALEVVRSTTTPAIDSCADLV